MLTFLIILGIIVLLPLALSVVIAVGAVLLRAVFFMVMGPAGSGASDAPPKQPIPAWIILFYAAIFAFCGYGFIFG